MEIRQVRPEKGVGETTSFYYSPKVQWRPAIPDVKGLTNFMLLVDFRYCQYDTMLDPEDKLTHDSYS